ncbi:single-stranded DNA-binding protein [Ligilactobacillus saerimneri]|uniref:single-stranded DNA-binding protein n=1 Tax=Ligilactobacillus saerimneri TaxID=228229 RepID=UPI0004141BFF|nr:single-stranded DNA-binding protein [Ligilactobacillus saerimneri]KRL74526.1 single-strand binding protein [Ligilactobacillus saerimneri DSM 16049]
MINRVVLTGRLTRDPELKFTNSGVAVATFTVAVDRQYRNQAGEREADFINCVIWRKSAENLVNYTHKGRLVGVDGRLQTRNYENQQGQRVYVTEVVVDSFSLLDSRNDNQGNGQQNYGNQGYQKQGGQQGGYQNQGNQQYNNGYQGNNQGQYQGNQQGYQGGQQNTGYMEPDPQQGRPINEDDLPF